MIEKDLMEKFKEFEREAKRAIEDKAIDSAVVLLSKATFALIDLFLFKNYGIVPSDHRKRKDAVRYRMPEILPYLNDVYDKYIAAYVQRMTETDLEVVENALGEIKERLRIEIG